MKWVTTHIYQNELWSQQIHFEIITSYRNWNAFWFLYMRCVHIYTMCVTHPSERHTARHLTISLARTSERVTETKMVWMRMRITRERKKEKENNKLSAECAFVYCVVYVHRVCVCECVLECSMFTPLQLTHCIRGRSFPAAFSLSLVLSQPLMIFGHCLPQHFSSYIHELMYSKLWNVSQFFNAIILCAVVIFKCKISIAMTLHRQWQQQQ